MTLKDEARRIDLSGCPFPPPPTTTFCFAPLKQNFFVAFISQSGARGRGGDLLGRLFSSHKLVLPILGAR